MLKRIIFVVLASATSVAIAADEDVASWARLEALTGALSIIEPTPESSESHNPFVAA